MSIRCALLGLLAEKTMHGYELKSKFDDITGGFWQLNCGQVYATLVRLQREGLVERVPSSGPSQSERRVFRITEEGRAAFEDWMAYPVAQPRPLRDDLFLRLAFCNGVSLETIFRMINRQHDACMVQLQRIRKRKGEPAPGPSGSSSVIRSLLMDAAEFYVEAELRWLSHIEGELTEKWSKRQERQGGRSARPFALRPGRPSPSALYR